MSIEYRPDNTIIFTIARMNPPTPGHLLLIRRLIDEALKKEVNDVYIFLSKTKDNDENPIACPEKINILGNVGEDVTIKNMINSLKQIMIDENADPIIKDKIKSMNIHAICVPDIPRATPFTPLSILLETKKDIPDLNLFLIIGRDRAEMIGSIKKWLIKPGNNIKSVEGQILERNDMSEFKSKSSDPDQLDILNMSDIPSEAISASFVRNIVKNKRRDKFQQLYAPYLDDEKIELLYNDILRAFEDTTKLTKKQKIGGIRKTRKQPKPKPKSKRKNKKSNKSGKNKSRKNKRYRRK